MKKTVDTKNTKEAKEKIKDIETFGNPDMWKLLCKASSKEEGWMKSTKGINIPGAGVIIQVSTQQGDHIAEALAFLPKVSLVPDNETQDRFVLIGYVETNDFEPFMPSPIPHQPPVQPTEPIPEVIQKFFEVLIRRSEQEEERAEKRRKSIYHDERREERQKRRREIRRDFWHFTEISDLYERKAKLLEMAKRHFNSDGKQDPVGIAAFNAAEYLTKAIEEGELIHFKNVDEIQYPMDEDQE
jgi:hypothetical protein